MRQIKYYLNQIRANFRNFYWNANKRVSWTNNWYEKMFSLIPPGHFYSPIPSEEEVLNYHDIPSGGLTSALPGIDLAEHDQIELLKKFHALYEELPFGKSKVPQHRYYFENDWFSYADGIILYSMIRYLKPKRIVEIGSGFSSALMLDVNEIFFNNSIQCNFIDPAPERLLSLLQHNDSQRCKIIARRMQDMKPVFLDELAENDILFIDSTHVSKIDSDVNHIFFNLLPNLQKGVVIHLHDIFYPFEYPKKWLLEGRYWNEGYLLHAFLQCNKVFQIMYFNSFMANFHLDQIAKYTPLGLINTGGSFWLRKMQ